MKKGSVEFTKKNQSVTYLVFDISSMVLVGYFTLALIPLTVRGETLSNSVQRKKTVSAFSNYNGGEIFFGIDDNGNIKGLSDVKQACLDIENKINIKHLRRNTGYIRSYKK